MIKKLFQRVLVVICMILMSVSTMLAQGQMTVTGTVTDEEGEPLIGASVRLKDSATGVSTNLDGQYAIQAGMGKALVFSYVGCKTHEVKVTGSVIDVVLKADNQILDEVVVVGYGVQKKSNVTGAISQVKAEDMQNRTISNAQQALQGKTAGVQVVQTSGAPGSAPAVRVRGYSSNVDMAPLYVVDGVRLSSISGIDPNDIESMEVLKDAASAAIYEPRPVMALCSSPPNMVKRATPGMVKSPTISSMPGKALNVCPNSSTPNSTSSTNSKDILSTRCPRFIKKVGTD